MKIWEFRKSGHFRAKTFTAVLFLTVLCIPSEAQSVNPSAKPLPPPGEPEEIIRVDSDLVTVPVTVMDRDGRYIADLTRDSFELFEGDIKQEISVFESVESPFTIIFLMDVSGSMNDQLAELVHAANIFVTKLRSEDKLMAIIFAGEVKTLLPPTKISELKKGINIKPRHIKGGNVIYDAVDYAFKRAKIIPGRKAIILFSNGVGSGFATAGHTLRVAEEQESLVYTVLFDKFPDIPPRYANARDYHKRVAEIRAYMQGLAAKTGGRSYRFEDIAKLDATFEMIVDELGRQYSLGYYPKNKGKAGERREIKVKVNRPGLAVRARDSYVVGKTKK